VVQKENILKLHLLSDLHLEFLRSYDVNDYIQPADVLVLAGDIHVGSRNSSEAVKRFAEHYEHVLYVPGNHEYYRTSIQEFHDNLVLPDNAKLLNPGTITIQGITFAGAALWTNFRNNPMSELAAKRAISDFRVIRDFNTSKAKEIFNQHYAFLKANPADVVITHFLPTPECVHPKFRGGDPLINYYFANDVLDVQPKLWLFGHTHEHMDFISNSTRYLAAPVGYPGEASHITGVVLDL
jgi:Icc-related predicted phosphoesterase